MTTYTRRNVFPSEIDSQGATTRAELRGNSQTTLSAHNVADLASFESAKGVCCIVLMAEPASGISSVPGGVKYQTKGFPRGRIPLILKG